MADSAYTVVQLQNLPEAATMTENDTLLAEQDGRAVRLAASLFKGEKGDKGADGTMTFEDLTPEQKASLKGDTGEKGDKGDTGDSPTISATRLADGVSITINNPDGTTQTVTVSDGAKGDKGDDGDTGPAGQDGTVSFDELTPAQIEQITGPAGPKGDPFVYSDFTAAQLEALRGPTGAAGPAGADGEDGVSPTASVSKTGSTTTLTVTDRDGTTTARIRDGIGVSVVSLDNYNLTWTSATQGTLTMTYAQRQEIMELARGENPLFLSLTRMSGNVEVAHFIPTSELLGVVPIISEPRVINIDGSFMGDSILLGFSNSESQTSVPVTVMEYTFATTWKGTQAQYDAMSSHASNTTYNIIEG